MMKLSKWNRLCHGASMVLWVLSLLAFVFAWFALLKSNLPKSFWGLDPLAWYINSFLLSVLAMGSKSCKENGCCEVSDQSGTSEM